MSRVPEPAEEQYDVLVLGAGPPGQNAADRCRDDGLSVAVVERELVGGECSYWACIPSKTLLRPVAALTAARSLPGSREAVTGEIDTAAVFGRRDSFVRGWRDDPEAAWLASDGIDLVRGHARIDGPRHVVVQPAEGAPRRLVARHAVIVATGSRAVLPPITGLAGSRAWTSREATSAKEVPRRLAVIGGGVVGTEMATLFRALGSTVTMLVRGEGLLERMEPFAGEIVAKALTEEGAEIRTGTSVTEVRRRDPGGPVTLVLDGGEEIVADEVLVATGRAPRTDDLGLETVGLDPGTWLPVDDTCQVQGVRGNWLYAVGDVNRRALLTHQGKYQGRIVGAVISARAQGVPLLETDPWGMHVATADGPAVPQVVFSEPEAAAVGLTQAEAEGRGLRVRAVDYDLGQVAGAAIHSEGYRGWARMVVDLDRECLVGVTFVGPGAGELLHSATIAVAAEVPIERLWHAVPAFPTISEVWLRLLQTYRSSG